MFSLLLPFIIVLPPLVYSLISLACGRSFFRRRRACPLRADGEGSPAPCIPCIHREFTPPVTILKPVKGADAESYENFASFCRQDYPQYQIVFAVASPADPAIPLIEGLRGEFPATDIELVIDGTLHGPNYKVCNLINAYPLAKHDIIVVCDSDIRVGSSFLREVCPPLADREVGLVTSLYRSSAVHGAATALESLGFSCEMVPNVMVALRLEGLSFALGAAMTVRREALEKIGGFASLVDYLADDYQLGNKLFRAGYRIELSDYFVESVAHRERLGAVLSRQLRWARTMRASRPGGYFASVITQPFPFALLALAISGCSMAGGAAFLALYAVRALVAISYSRYFLRDGILPRWLWLLPARDAVAFSVWGLAFLGNRVRWRGHLFRLLPGGRITQVPEHR